MLGGDVAWHRMGGCGQHRLGDSGHPWALGFAPDAFPSRQALEHPRYSTLEFRRDLGTDPVSQGGSPPPAGPAAVWASAGLAAGQRLGQELLLEPPWELLAGMLSAPAPTGSLGFGADLPVA